MTTRFDTGSNMIFTSARRLHSGLCGYRDGPGVGPDPVMATGSMSTTSSAGDLFGFYSEILAPCDKGTHRIAWA